MALLQFDASRIQPDTGVMDAIPAGWYIVAPDASEIKPTKAGDGSAYLELRLVVLDGQFKDRKLFARFNLKNNNPQAVEIAYKQLSALCHAVGLLQVNDSQELHGRPLKVKVSVKPADGQYEASNEIKAYRNVQDNSMNVAAAAPAGAPAFGAPPAGYGAPAVGPVLAAPPAWQPQAAQQTVAQQPVAQPPAQAWTPPNAQQPWAPAQQPQQQPAAPQQQAPAPAWAPPAGAAGGAAPPWVQQPTA